MLNSISLGGTCFPNFFQETPGFYELSFEGLSIKKQRQETGTKLKNLRNMLYLSFLPLDGPLLLSS